MAVHRAANVEKHQHFHLVAALGNQLDVEIAGICRGFDGVIKVEHVGLAIAGEFAQAAQGHFDVARAQLNTVIEVFIVALVPDFDGLEVFVFVLADANAFRVVAVGAKGRGAARADPFIATFVALVLFFEALFQLLHNFFPAAERFDLGLFFFRQEFFRQRFQPVFRNFGNFAFAQAFQPFEHFTEYAVELVEIALVFHQRGAREVVEVFHLMLDNLGVQRLQKRQIFAQRHRHGIAFQFVEKIDEHIGLTSANCARGGRETPDAQTSVHPARS